MTTRPGASCDPLTPPVAYLAIPWYNCAMVLHEDGTRRRGFIIDIEKIEDERGFLCVCVRCGRGKRARGWTPTLVAIQDQFSIVARGTIRGMHWQAEPARRRKNWCVAHAARFTT